MARSKLSPVVAPSVLAADLAALGDECEAVLDAGADWIHFDVMDNHYVPNLTFGPPVAAALARRIAGRAPLDVHLMVKPVDALIAAFARAGASSITFHPEASEHVDRSLAAAREAGCAAGLVFNPATPLDALRWVIDKVDIVLVMSVNPGFGGQSFIAAMLAKIAAARALIDASDRAIRLQVDGGVSAANAGQIAAAGADTLVAGSAIFGAADYRQAVRELRAACDSARAG